MIIDTSAALAILMNEEDAEHYARAVAADPYTRMSAASFLEAAIVLESRFGTAGAHRLDTFLTEAQIGIEPVTTEQARVARQAWRRFGKGNQPAGLNFGDCFAYTLAKATREPLLFKAATSDSLTSRLAERPRRPADARRPTANGGAHGPISGTSTCSTRSRNGPAIFCGQLRSTRKESVTRKSSHPGYGGSSGVT